jgi:putative transposase
MVALCREYGISRKTGYKWLGRYRCEGAAGLRERSPARLRHGQAHDVAVVQAVLGLRERRLQPLLVAVSGGGAPR